MSSFFDRVRETASDLGNQAQRGIDQGQAKLDETRLRRECDDLARQIGYLVQRGRAGGVADQAEIDHLCALLAAREADIVTIRHRAAAQPQPAPTGWGQPPQQPSAPPGQVPAGWNQPTQAPPPPQAGRPPQPPGQWSAQPAPGPTTADGLPEAPEAPAWGERPPAPSGATSPSVDELPEAPTWGQRPPAPGGPGQAGG
jgi:hypothetical protein